MTHGNGRKPHAHVLADPTDGKRRAAGVISIKANTHFRIQRSNLFEQGFHFSRCRPVVQGCHQLNGRDQTFEVGLELGFQWGVQHGISS